MAIIGEAEVRQLFDRESCTYTYLVFDKSTREGLLIDTVKEQLERDLQWVQELGVELRYVLDTHIHADHTTAAGLIRDRIPGCQALSGPKGPACATRHLADGDEVRVGSVVIQALATPGHTDGCTSFLIAGAVFTGDTLLVRGCGRTDFQNGDAATLYHSVSQVLFSLPGETRVFPGHDYRGFTSSSIEEERRFNPRLGGKSQAEFVKIMSELRLDLPKKIMEAVPANQRCGLVDQEESPMSEQGVNYNAYVRQLSADVQMVTPGELSELLEQKQGLVVDIREQDEISDTGTVPGAEVVSRGLLEKHLALTVKDRSAPITLICATGNRSVVSADTLKKMGFQNVSSLKGGMDAWMAEQREIRGGAASPASVHGNDWTWERIRQDFPITGRRVPVLGGAERELVFLDHAASTQPPRFVLDRYYKFMSEDYANIHRGTYQLSRSASQRFDAAYGVAAEFIGGNLNEDCVTFLTNTTQAIDLCAYVMKDVPGHTLVSMLEHHSNDLPHRRHGDVLRARATENGELDMGHLEELLKKNRVKLVAITGGSNCTGWMPDIHRIARLAHEHGAKIMVDGAQLLAHHHVDVKPPGDPEHLDFFVAAGHKSYAPLGASFLYGPRSLLDAVLPYIPGGGTAAAVTPTSVEFVNAPDRHQGGTPNIGGVIAFADAMRLLKQIGMDRVREHELEMLRPAIQGLQEMEGVTLYGPPDAEARLGVVSFNVHGVTDLFTAAVLSEERALACRNGRFCSHIQMDHLLKCQGGTTEADGVESGAVRASFGLYNTVKDVEQFLDGVKMVRDKAWVGKYSVKKEGVSAETALRCNDLWMEASE